MKKFFLMMVAMLISGSAAKARDVVVAVIDTGLDSQDLIFQNHLWTNSGETGMDSLGRNKSTNGVDDDGNGFVDDVHGWDFTMNQGKLTDEHGHGTHIAGLILHADRPLPEAPHIRLMILKYYDPESGFDPVEGSRRALRYAVENGADVINYSGGGPLPDSVERALLEQARAKGILVVAAAGNESSDVKKRPYYPASYGFSNIVSVAALNGQDELLPSSNFGSSVDLAAPGWNLFSNLPGGRVGRMSGTSQATALVTASAARMFPGTPARPSAELLKQQLMQDLIPLPQLNGKVRGAGKLRPLVAATQARNTQP